MVAGFASFELVVVPGQGALGAGKQEKGEKGPVRNADKEKDK